MDELGSYPRLEYTDHNQYTRDADEQNGSWFGLAISGLRFLINQQRNDNANNHYQSDSPSSPNPTTAATKHHDAQSKLHILGPSVFKKQLYDIPEYQSTASSASGDNKKCKGTRPSLKTNSRLTKRALQQFNGNFSNYWNQRSSLHQTSEAGSTDAASVRSKRSKRSRAMTDGGSSTMPRPTESVQPSPSMEMASSQIIHPTQAKPSSMTRSRSWPLLHSAEYIQKFGEFSKDNIDAHYFEEEEGSQCLNSIPSPPPISNSAEVIDPGFMLSNFKTVHALKSWGSGPSTNDELVSNHSNDTDGIVFVDHHVQRERANLKRSRMSLNMKRSQSALRVSDLGSNWSSNTGSTAGGMVEEVDWERMAGNETINMISKPLPKSIRKKRKKKRAHSSVKGDEDEVVFSDWSNVSSNVGVITTTTPLAH